MKTNKMPERMCVACREMKPKSELIRVVNTANGAVIDYTGKLNGRGVYLCKSATCINRALKDKKFERTHGFALGAVSNDLEKIIEG